jgi:hypothetical protein
MELAEDRVQCQALVLAVLNFLVLLPVYLPVIRKEFRFLTIRIISFSYLFFVLAYCRDRPKASQWKVVTSVVTFRHPIEVRLG